MRLRKCIIIITLVVLTSFLFSCGSDAKVVNEIPSGFIKLNDRGVAPKNILKYEIDEKEVLFLDADGTCIYQTELVNNDFIVKFDNSYYIKEEKYVELFDKITVSKVVKELPSGFIKLSTVGDYYYNDTNDLHYKFEDTKISFLDAKDTIYETDLSNSDFIVIFNYEYYINYDKYLELINIATAPKTVQIKPEGFIPLVNAVQNQKNGLDFVFFETQISFLVADKCIYQTAIYNDNFLLKYQNEFYVNETQFQNIIRIANDISKK